MYSSVSAPSPAPTEQSLYCWDTALAIPPPPLSVRFFDQHRYGDMETLVLPVNNVSFNNIMLGFNVFTTFFNEDSLDL